MAKQLQLRRGTTSQHSTFTGANGEVTIDTDKKVVVVHDGATAGGIPLAKQATVDTKVDKVTSTDNAVVRFNGTTGDVQNSGVVIDDGGYVGIGTSSPSRKLEVQSYGVGAAGIIRISGYAGSNSTTNTSLLELSITGAGGGIVTQNLTARYNNGYEIATYFADRVSWRDNATNTQLFAIDSSGNALVTNSTGALGYGAGAGGTVTQLTSKSTAVTLNKPSGHIYTAADALAANNVALFAFNNSLLTAHDTVYAIGNYNNYRVEAYAVTNGSCVVRITNVSGASQSQSIDIKFVVIKGATD